MGVVNGLPNGNQYYISAYGIAVKHGFEGTEEEWLEYLKARLEFQFDLQTGFAWRNKGEEEWQHIPELDETFVLLDKAANDAEDLISDYDDARQAAEHAIQDLGPIEEATQQARDDAVDARDGAETARDQARIYATNAGTSATSASGSAATATAAADRAVQSNAHPPKLEDGSDNWWLWDGTQYVDSGFVARGPHGETGETGVSIDRVEQTGGTGAPGTVDTYTVYLGNGESAGTFNVFNGHDGAGSGDMTADVYDPQGKRTDVFQYVDNAIAAIVNGNDIEY